MYAMNFEAPIINGILTIPHEYQEKIKQNNNVKVILMIDENYVKPIKKRELNAVSLDLSDFKFDRDKAHER
jgi:hypothetical protein